MNKINKCLPVVSKLRLKIKREVGVDLSEKELKAIFRILIGPYGRLDKVYCDVKE